MRFILSLVAGQFDGVRGVEAGELVGVRPIGYGDAASRDERFSLLLFLAFVMVVLQLLEAQRHEAGKLNNHVSSPER
jgi:hypothetical protein